MSQARIPLAPARRSEPGTRRRRLIHSFPADQALALEEGFESWALAARTRYWWARALAERGASGDLARARELLDACLDRTRAFGMAYLTEQAETLSVRLG